MKINEHFYLNRQSFNGLTVKDNKIVKTFLGSVPDCMVEKTQQQLTKEEKSRRDKWWYDYATNISKTNDQKINSDLIQLLWKNHQFALSPTEFFALTDSIETDLGSKDRAQGLVNWLGGAGIYNGAIQKYHCFNDPESYLDTPKITTELTKTPWTVGDLLADLKKKNPAAHSYILQKAFAKAKKVKISDDHGYSFFNNQTVKKAQEAVKKAAEAAIDIPISLIESATERAEEAAWIVRNIKWIVLATVVGGGYLVWRNRKEVAELAGVAARAAITKGK